MRTVKGMAFSLLVGAVVLAVQARVLAWGEEGAAVAGWYACQFDHYLLQIEGNPVYGGWHMYDCEDWEHDNCTGGSHEWFDTEAYGACYTDCDQAGRVVSDYDYMWCEVSCVCGPQ